MVHFSMTDNPPLTNLSAQRAERMIEEAHLVSPRITPNALAKLIAEKRPFGLIDIRTETEFNEGHLRNSVWLSRGLLEFAIRDGELGFDQSKIVLYCRSGNRSALAVKQLMELGFTDICHLEGGFRAWFEQGYSFFNSHGEIRGIVFEREEQG
jgi:rhodanese-related sulfurtransferase